VTAPALTCFNVLRSPSGVLIHGPSCSRGILTASHWVADFTCRCSEALETSREELTVSATVAPSQSREVPWVAAHARGTAPHPVDAGADQEFQSAPVSAHRNEQGAFAL
jgi:hypothetical protein